MMNKYLLLITLWLVSLSCQANFNEGVAAYEKGDYQTAVKEWTAIAEPKSTVTGDFEWRSSQSVDTIEAQYALGLLYWQGKGVAQNYREAEKWLVLAANSGHSDAQLKLAYLYLKGFVGKPDAIKASKWFEESAKQGNVDAQYNLGLMYWKGLGVEKNEDTAKKWLNAAIAQANHFAKKLLAEMNQDSKQSDEFTTNAFDSFNTQNDSAPQAKLPPIESASNSKPTQAAATPIQFTAATNAPKTVDTQNTSPAIISIPTAKLTPVESTINSNSIQTADSQGIPLATQMNDYYAIQLISSPKQNDVQAFMESWRDILKPLVIMDKVKKDELIFIVIYGNYSSMVEAKQAMADLPAELRRNKPWVVEIHGNSLENIK